MRILATFACVLVAGTLSFTIAQENIPSTDELLKAVPGLSSIPGFDTFNTSSVKTEDFEKLLREKCEKNGAGSTAFDAAKDSAGNFKNCLESLVNVTELQAEMQEARPHGELDTVFQKYCRRVPTLRSCVRNLTNVLEPCLDEQERAGVKVTHNITDSLLNFVCFNDGDRIAMFIAAGGIECFRAMEKNVTACANESLSSYMPAANATGGTAFGLTSIPQLVVGPKQCTDIKSFKSCTVKVLEECKDPTPANVVESLFNLIEKRTGCEIENPSGRTGGGAGGGAGTYGPHNVVHVLLVTIAMFMSLSFV